MAEEIRDQYLTASAYESALNPHPHLPNPFPLGKPWNPPAPKNIPEDADEPTWSEPFGGDQVLANGAKRMLDSMLQYELQSSIADGDIGRALNVISVSFSLQEHNNALIFSFRSGCLLSQAATKASTLTSCSSSLATLSSSTQRSFNYSSRTIGYATWEVFRAAGSHLTFYRRRISNS